jgi:Tol biopolymer transport system component
VLAFGATVAPASASPVPEPPELWVMNADGTDQRLLVSDADWSPHPSWSPDARFLAYTANHGKISVVPADGSAQAVTIASGDHADWSPDGSSIAFVHTPAGNGAPGTLYVSRPDGSAMTPVAADAAPGGVAWSPDGTRIAYHGCYETPCEHSLAVVGLDGSRASVATGADFGSDPSWSPDGSAVTFGAQGDVWVVDLASGGVRNLTPGSGSAFGPDWGPARKIAYAEHLEVPGGTYVVDPEGTVASFVHEGGSPQWSPDGTRLLTSFQGDLFVKIPGTTGAPNLTSSDAIEYGGLWSPDGDRVAYHLEPEPEPGGQQHDRSLSASLSGRVVVGKLGVPDGFTGCAARVPVLLQRFGRRGWSTVDRSETTNRGRVEFELGRREGLYRVKAPRAWVQGGWFEPDECAPVSTPPLRYRGR